MSENSDPSPNHSDIETTEDGIPLFVNGRRLSTTDIEALREAKGRKDKACKATAPKELGGADRENDPTRYGDWEKDGRAIDFS